MALLPGWKRAFCRYSFHHRGTAERPGLVVGLRPGEGCVGVAFAVARAGEAAALAYLDQREGAGYHRQALPVRLLPGDAGSPDQKAPKTVTAWCYIPNPEHPSYFGAQDPALLVRLVAEGRGQSGTALDYLRELIIHLDRMGVEEPEMASILAAAEHYNGNGNAL